MHHPHMFRQSKTRRDILHPQYHRTALRQKSDCHDHHYLCHVQQATPCSRDNPHLHLNDNGSDTVEPHTYYLRQAPSTKETFHCYFCPHFRGKGPGLKMNKVESNICVQHHKSCCYDQHESQFIHLEPGSRSPESSEDEERHYYTGHYHPQGIHSNERQHHPPTVKHFHSKISNDPFDCVHSDAAPPARSRATVCKPHEDGCGSNIKAVRFEEDDRMPGYAETHHSNCLIHHTTSVVEGGYHSQRSSHGQQRQSRDSRTYRWVWGPPLPAVVPRRGKIYYVENY